MGELSREIITSSSNSITHKYETSQYVNQKHIPQEGRSDAVPVHRQIRVRRKNHLDAEGHYFRGARYSAGLQRSLP